MNERVKSKIKRASELPQRARFLIYGRSGQRKTRTASTAPNVLIIDVNEEGTDSVRRDIDPNVYPVYYWDELNDVYWFLQSGDHDFESFAIDGLTGMQNLCIKFVLGDEAARDASKDPAQTSRQTWGKVAELMKTQVTNFRNLPMNAIFTALERKVSTGGEDLEDEETFISPALSPSIAGHVEAAVGLIGRIQNKEVFVKKRVDGKVKRVRSRRCRLMVGMNDSYLTKDRYGVFGEYIDSPNITTMLEQIYGAKEE